MSITSKLISILLNPLIVSPITFYLLIFSDNDNTDNSFLFFICFITSTIIPATIIAYFKYIGKISGYEAPIRNERLPLLFFASMSNAIGFFLLNYFNAPPIVKGLMFCYSINTAITYAITKYWKISIHMIGLGGPIVALHIFGLGNYATFTIIIFLVYISRFLLKAHNHAQLIAGVTLAMILAYLELTYLFL